MNFLKLEFEKTYFAPHEEIKFNLSWDLTEIADRKIEIHLFWHTEGSGDEDVVIFETQCLFGEPLIGNTNVSFTAPRHPYSFSGKYFSLFWNIEAVLPNSKLTTNETIEISPTPQKIILVTEK